MKALARLSSLLRGGLPGREVMSSVMSIVPEIIPADAYAIWRYQYREEEWQIIASAGLSQEFRSHSVAGPHDDALLRDGPFVMEDVFASPHTEARRAFYASEGIRSIFILPLHLRGETAGTLNCYFRRPHEIGDAEKQLAEVVADVVASAINLRKFDRFAEAARVASAELDLERIVQNVTDAATEMINAQFGAFFYNVVNDAGESYTLYTISGVPREAFSRFPMPRNTAVFEPTFAGRGTVRSSDIRKDPRYGRNPPHNGMPAGHLPVVSYLAVPVIARSGEVLGGLFFGHEEEGVFTEAEEQIVEALAAQAAVAIDNARLYDRLMRSEARYRALVTARPARQAIWTTSADGRVLDDLPSWRELTGQTVEEVRDRGWSSAIHPLDRERVDAAWARAVEEQRAFSETFRLRVGDGSYRWMSTNGVPVVRNGEVLEWVGTSVDIDDQKTADDRLRFLAETSDVLSSSLDFETTLSTVARLAVPEIADWCAVDIADEDGTYRRLAVAHVDPTKVELAHELRRRYPADPATDTVARVIRTGQSEWMRDIPAELIDRSARDAEHFAMIRDLGLMSFIAVPLRVHDRVLGALTFVLSESQRRFNEADLAFAEELGRRAAVAIDNARLYSAAQAANIAKDDFLATLSHELRTPMTSVLGWSRMLKMGLTDGETVEAADAIERSASVQMQLIEDVLDMSRIMAGKMRIESVPVDLCAVTDAAVATMRPAAAVKGIEIFTSFPGESAYVVGDESRLQQIVWNLLTNAVKFTDNRGDIMLRVTQSAETVSLTVRDSGMGIEPTFLPHVFERFRQQDSSTTRAHGGIGLGLAIVRHLVELHGGRIRAESEGPGRGSLFTVELPALRTHRAAPRREGTPHELPALEGISVLVIDDEPMTRDVIAAILRRSRADVTTVDSALAAHEMLGHARPDAILCDIAMPGQDGYAFIRTLRTREPGLADLPVIALTAFGRPEDREKALNSGFDAYLKKPVDPITLAGTIRDLLERRRG